MVERKVEVIVRCGAHAQVCIGGQQRHPADVPCVQFSDLLFPLCSLEALAHLMHTKGTWPWPAGTGCHSAPMACRRVSIFSKP